MMNIPLALIAGALPKAQLTGQVHQMISSVVADSREVKPGALYACLQGARFDGHAFAADAIARGACGLLVEKSIKGIDQHKIGVIKVADVALALKRLAPLFYNYPSSRLTMIGVTGTNGKTTFTYLMRAILEKNGMQKHKKSQVGLMGTIAYEIAGQKIAAKNTTPMVWDVQRLLAQMVTAQCQAAVMEVSSHALAEDRIAGCEFDIGVFTNLTPEHLDFHHSMAAYARAKQKLFKMLGQPGLKSRTKVAVIHRDDPYAEGMIKAAKGVRVMTYGIDKKASVTAKDIKFFANGTRFQLHTPNGSIKINLRLLGRYNVSNALAAAAAALALGVSLPKIKSGLASVQSVPGRMEIVPGKQKFTIVVDYAHTPDALKNVLQAVREYTTGKILLVFGCGGDRDHLKREPMGRLAVEYADVVMVTSDNPRRENPEQIMRQVLQGCQSVLPNKRCATSILSEGVRSQAIVQVLAMAQPGDTVLIAGKGHENYQILKHKTIRSDDRSIAREGIKQLNRRRAWKA